LNAKGAGAQAGWRGGGQAAERAPAESLARWVFALLVLGCIGAFFLTQHLKHLPTAVQEFKVAASITPGSSGAEKVEAFSFRLRYSDEVTVRIAHVSGATVATLVRDWPLKRYRQFYLRWNGRRGIARRYERQLTAHGNEILVALPNGAIAPAGEYRVEVTLRRQRKTVRSPASFLLRR
jgi:hypothetical protein